MVVLTRSGWVKCVIRDRVYRIKKYEDGSYVVLREGTLGWYDVEYRDIANEVINFYEKHVNNTNK